MECKTAPRRNGTARRRGRRGFSLIEVLVASVVVAVCLAATISMWYFSFGLSVRADMQGVAYNLGRKEMEDVKQAGFQDTAEGTSIVYFDKQGGSESATLSSSHVYKVTTVVTSSALSGSSPAPSALRTVTVTVTSLATGQTIYQASTYLARAGT